MPFQTDNDHLPQDVQNLVKDRYGDVNVALLALPIYSRVRFTGTISGGNLITIPAQTVTAFSYGQNQDMTPAGQPNVKATQADTNLNQGGQTLNNSDVLIYGLGIAVDPDSEPKLAAALVKNVALTISTDGRTFLPMGRIEDYPQAGGLFGVGQSALSLPGLAQPGAGADGGAGAPFGFATNGNPLAGSFGRFEGGPLLWSGQSARSSDNTLSVQFILQRAITFAVAATRAAAAGVAAWTQPTANSQGTYVDFVVSAKNYSINVVSSNA